MRLLYFVLFSVLVSSCQPSKPSELELYHLSKNEATQKLEAEFSKRLSLTTAKLKEAPIDAKNFVASSKSIQTLKQTLTTLQPSNNQASVAKNNIASITPSTNPEQIRKLDSTAKTQTTELVRSDSKTNNAALLLNVRDYQDTYYKIHKLSAKYGFNIANEKEETTDFYKSNTMEIYASPENFDAIVADLRNSALILRQKHLWQQEENSDFLRLQSDIATTANLIQQLKEQLNTATNTEDKLRIQNDLTTKVQDLDFLVLNATAAINNKPFSCILVAFYQNLDAAKPIPNAFSADLSTNLLVGWANFKVFVLEAALVWPYIALSLLGLLIMSLVISSKRKKERQLKLQNHNNLKI